MDCITYFDCVALLFNDSSSQRLAHELEGTPNHHGFILEKRDTNPARRVFHLLVSPDIPYLTVMAEAFI